MNRTSSTNYFVGTRADRSPSKRTIYVNQEVQKREIHTPFHSPFKDGRRNPHYNNPSFISSNLFYPSEVIQNKTQNLNLTSNHVPNINDIKKQELYRKRINTEIAIERKNTQDYRARQFQRKDLSQYRVQRTNEPESLLRNELQTLQNYRQEIENKKGRITEISRKKYEEPIEPVFLQKGKHGRSLMTFSPNKTSINYLQNKAMTHELDSIRRQLKQRSDDEQYRCNLDKLIERNQQMLLEEEQQHRRQKELLGNILRQQIRTNRDLKEKRWRY